MMAPPDARRALRTSFGGADRAHDADTSSLIEFQLRTSFQKSDQVRTKAQTSVQLVKDWQSCKACFCRRMLTSEIRVRDL